MTLIIVGITILYVALIGSFVIGFDKVKISTLDETKADTTLPLLSLLKMKLKI